MVLETILASEFAVKIVYPFLLVFVLIFAILQKSKLFGEDKRQIDALIALSIALIFVAFGWATEIITNMMPFLAIALVTILVFMLIFGFVASGENGLEIPFYLKIAGVVFATVVVVIALIVATGQWEVIYGSLFGEGAMSEIWVNIILVVVVVAAVAAVVFSGKSNNGGD